MQKVSMIFGKFDTFACYYVRDASKTKSKSIISNEIQVSHVGYAEPLQWNLMAFKFQTNRPKKTEFCLYSFEMCSFAN